VKEDKANKLIRRLVKQTLYCTSFVWNLQNGSFQTLIRFQFLNRFLFRSSTEAWVITKGVLIS